MWNKPHLLNALADLLILAAAAALIAGLSDTGNSGLNVRLMIAVEHVDEAARSIRIGGMDGAGKGETVNQLNEWLDTRLLLTRAFDHQSSDEERERPLYWRYWRELPARGRIGTGMNAGTRLGWRRRGCGLG